MAEILLREYIDKIQALIGIGRVEEAIAHGRHLLRLYPKQIQIYALMGEACLATGRFREAADFFLRALSADPENPGAWIGWSRVNQAQGLWSEAAWRMERALELAPRDPLIRRELIRCMHEGGVQSVTPKLTRSSLARLYVRGGLYEQAASEFRDQLRRHPDRPDLQVALAEALWRVGCNIEAAEVCLDILETLPFCLKAQLILGTIYFHNGQRDAALARFDAANELDPEHLMAQEVLGTRSPLPPQQVLVPVLTMEGVAPPSVDEIRAIPDWVRALGTLASVESGGPVKATGTMD
jgi:tetratricopeptide (TPR) repeat protein